MEESSIIVALDIGTTKTCVIVGRRNMDGLLEIIGAGRAPSIGMQRGVIHNINNMIDAIQRAVAEAEQDAGYKIREVYVGIAGQHIKSLRHRGYKIRSNYTEEITQEDIDLLKADMHRMVLPPGEQIIHVIPQEYIVDNESGIVQPIGMAGSRIEADFHIVTGQITSTANIYRCVQRAGLELKGLILEPIASSSAVLTADEKEVGVALVDIGGGTTDLAIYHNNVLRHTAVIPYGGNLITEDVKQAFMLLGRNAEELKVKCGSALSVSKMAYEIINLPGLNGRPPKQINVASLAKVIQARMEDILMLVNNEITRSGFNGRLAAGIVVTGGGAQLKNLPYLIEYYVGCDARVGIPKEILAPNSPKYLYSPVYATSLGLIFQGLEYERLLNTRLSVEGVETKTGVTGRESIFRKVFGGIKQTFNPETDEIKDWDQ